MSNKITIILKAETKKAREDIKRLETDILSSTQALNDNQKKSSKLYTDYATASKKQLQAIDGYAKERQSVRDKEVANIKAFEDDKKKLEGRGIISGRSKTKLQADLDAKNIAIQTKQEELASLKKHNDNIYNEKASRTGENAKQYKIDQDNLKNHNDKLASLNANKATVQRSINHKIAEEDIKKEKATANRAVKEINEKERLTTKLYNIEQQANKLRIQENNENITETKRILKERTADKEKYVDKVKANNKKLKALALEEASDRKAAEKWYRQTYVNTKATNAYENAIEKLKHQLDKNRISASQYNIALKKEKENLKQATLAAKQHGVAQGNLKNDIVRHLRQIETLVIAYYALSRGYQTTIGAGIEVNKMMEDNTSGIAALLSANTQMVLSNGQVVNSYEKFVIGQKIAKQTMEDIRKASVDTFATFPQLTQLVQQSIGHTLGMGKSFGTTTDEIIKNTIKFTQSMSNIAGSVGMEMQKAQEEVRSMLSGNVSTDSLLAVMLFGSPTKANEAIREAKKRGENGVSDMLTGMMKAFEPLKDLDSYTKNMLKLQDAWSQTMQKMAEPVYEDLKVTFKELAKDIEDNRENIIESFKAIYEGGKQVVSIMDTMFIPAVTIASVYALSAASTALVNKWIALRAVMATNPLGAAILAGTVATVAAIEYAKKYEEQAIANTEALDGYLQKTKQVYNTQQIASKFDALVIAQNNLKRMQLQNLNEVALKFYKNQVVNAKTAYEETIQIYKADSEAYIKAQKEKEDATGQAADAKLLTKIAVDYEYIGKRLAENNKAKEENLKLQNQINKSEEQLGKLGQVYAGAVTEETKLASLESMEQLLISIANDENKQAENELKALQDKMKKEFEVLDIALEIENTKKEIAGVEVDKLDTLQLEIDRTQALLLLTNQEGFTKEQTQKADLKYHEAILAFIKEENVEKEKQKKTADDLLAGFAKVSADYADKTDIPDDLLIEPITLEIKMKGFDDVSNALAGIGNGMQDLMHINTEYEKDLIKIEKANLSVEETEEAKGKASFKNATATIGSYANMTGAMASFYDEDDDRRKKQEQIAKAMQIANMAAQSARLIGDLAEMQTKGVIAVLTQGTGDPYTAFARMAAMAAVVASLGVALSGGGSGGATASATASEAGQAGTFSDYGIDVDTSLEEAIKELTSKIEVQNKIYESLGEFGGTFENTLTMGMIDISKSMTDVWKAEFGGATQADFLGTIIGFDANKLTTSNYSTGVTQYYSSLLDMFGALTDFETAFNIDLDAIGGNKADVLAAQSTISIALDEYTLTLIELYEEMDSYRNDWIDIFEDATGSNKYTSQQLSEAFSDVESLRVDVGSVSITDLYKDLIDAYDVDFEELRDMYENSTQVELIQYMSDTFPSMSFDPANVYNYIDSLELVGEALVTSTENIIEWTQRNETLEQTAQRLSDTMGIALVQNVSELDSLSIKLSTDVEGLTDADLGLLEANEALIEARDSETASIRDNIKAWKDNFKTTEELTIDLLESISSYSTETITRTIDFGWFGDFTYTYERLVENNLKLAESYAELDALAVILTNDTDGLTDADLELLQANKALLDTQADAIGSVVALSEAFSGLGDSIDETIETLLGNQTGADTQDELITSYWDKRGELDALLLKDGDLTATEQETLSSLVGDINTLSLGIQGATEGDTTQITENLVGELEGLKSALDLDKQILNVRIVEFQDTLTLDTQAEEIGVLSALPSYDVGSAYIPYDQTANIHRGEMILDADFSSKLRQYGLPQPANNSIANAEFLAELKQISARLKKIESTNKTTAESTESMYNNGITMQEAM